MPACVCACVHVSVCVLAVWVCLHMSACVCVCLCVLVSRTVCLGLWAPTRVACPPLRPPPKEVGPLSARGCPRFSAGPVRTPLCWPSSRGAARGRGARVWQEVFIFVPPFRVFRERVGGVIHGERHAGGFLHGMRCLSRAHRSLPPCGAHAGGDGLPVSPSPPRAVINPHPSLSRRLSTQTSLGAVAGFSPWADVGMPSIRSRVSCVSWGPISWNPLRSLPHSIYDARCFRGRAYGNQEKR